MRTALIACAIAIGSAAPLGVTAQTAAPPAAAPAPTPEFTFTGNAGLFSDYRFRGFTQTDYKPAFQGGFDFAHKSGFYWATGTPTSSRRFTTEHRSRWIFTGVIRPRSVTSASMSASSITTILGRTSFRPASMPRTSRRISVARYGPASLKYFYSFTDFFGLNSNDLGLPGNIDTKGSQYVDLTLTFPLDGGWAIVAHGGWQKINNLKDFGPNVFGVQDDSYFDWKLGRQLRHRGVGLDRRSGSRRHQRKESVHGGGRVGRGR